MKVEDGRNRQNVAQEECALEMLLLVLLMCNRMVQKSMLVRLSGVAIDESVVAWLEKDG